MDVQCLYAGRNLLGESPIWHAAQKKLYWVDAIKPSLHALDPKTGQHQEWLMPALIGSIAPCATGGLIAAMGTGFAWIDLPSGTIRMHCVVNEALTPTHLNDGKCDRQGRFWAGEVSHDRNAAQGKLYCLQPNGQVEIKMRDLRLFNGPCWSPCNGYFYFTDSAKPCTIFRCDFDLKTATLGPRQIFIQTPENDDGIMDGCTIDQEGYLWSAKWNGYRLTRYAPTGQIDFELELPVRRPTSCIFGGKDLDTLFITSASKDVGEEKPEADTAAGRIYAIQFKDYRGIAETPFGG